MSRRISVQGRSAHSGAAHVGGSAEAHCFSQLEKESDNMRTYRGRGRFGVAVTVVTGVALTVSAVASAHARVSPVVSVSKELQLYSLAVPTEKENLATSKIVLTVPQGFGIDSFVASPGWTRRTQTTGSGDSAVVQKVTWTGGSTPTGEDSLFQFLAQPDSAKAYVFQVEQTYSDGSIVNWSGSESSADPAPTIEVKSSLGGGGSSTFAIVAVVLAGVALVLAGVALLSRSGSTRELA
jgi:uncharacterized protein YcnI